MRVLVCGWFSFDQMGATAGDLLACDVILSWLDAAQRAHDVALTPVLGSGVDWSTVDPAIYTDLVFVCGPLGKGEPATDLFDRFAHARLIGVDLSMLQDVSHWNPFDLLLERDSERTSRPDIALLADSPLLPVIGVVLVHEQEEYAAGRHREVHAAIEQMLRKFSGAQIRIDTCLDPMNTTYHRTAAQIESVIARVDVIVTTRLHGLVLGLKHGVPVVAVDPVAGGAKVLRQAKALGWPHVLTPDNTTPEELHTHVTDCLTADARALARRCGNGGREALSSARDVFVSFMSQSQDG